MSHAKERLAEIWATHAMPDAAASRSEVQFIPSAAQQRPKFSSGYDQAPPYTTSSSGMGEFVGGSVKWEAHGNSSMHHQRRRSGEAPGSGYHVKRGGQQAAAEEYHHGSKGSGKNYCPGKGSGKGEAISFSPQSANGDHRFSSRVTRQANRPGRGKSGGKGGKGSGVQGYGGSRSGHGSYDSFNSTQQEPRSATSFGGGSYIVYANGNGAYSDSGFGGGEGGYGGDAHHSAPHSGQTETEFCFHTR